MSQAKRSQISERLRNVQQYLPEVLHVLRASSPEHYASILVELRSERSFSANLKQQSGEDTRQEGCVLRIYDGFTLFESAVDQWERGALIDAAEKLVKKVNSTPKPVSAPRPYRAPTWKERLQAKLDPEITEQIPADVGATTWVHFGTKQNEPLWLKDAEIADYVRELLLCLKDKFAHLPESHPAAKPDFLEAKIVLANNEFLFIDAESRLSQSISRNRIGLLATKGKDFGFVRNGGIGGRETLKLTEDDWQEVSDYLAKSIKAERLSPGRYRLLMGPDVTGTFAHEAFGHSQEGDTCARGRSQAWELYKSGQLVGNEHATIINNPAVYSNADKNFGAWGSYYFDEEGWLAEEQVLVDRGRLCAPMTNLTSALRLGVPRTANGKRENWSRGVYTRQTNTYFSPGSSTFAELLEKIDYGFLAMFSAGGMEDPKGMGIQVGIAFLEEVKAGKLTGRIFRGPSGGAVQMTGYTPDYLNSILGKSKIDYHSDQPDQSQHPLNTVGGCGKYHKELVAAGSGGPLLLVDNVLLG